MKSISSKFISAVSWTTLASLVARASGLVVSILMARFLGSNALGMYTIVLATLGLFATFLNFGLGLTASKVVAQYYMKDPEKVGRVISLLFLTLVVAIFFGALIYWNLLPYISNHIYKIPKLFPVLKLSLLWLIIMCVNQLFESILAGLQGFKLLMLTNSILSLLNLPLILLAFYLGGSNVLSALVVVGTLTAILQLVLLLFVVCLEAKKYGIVLSFQQLKPLIRPVLFDFSVPAFIGKVMEQPLSWVAILLLVKLSGSISYVGGLTVITNIRTWLLYLPTMLVSVLIPLFTDIYHTRDISDFRRTLVFNQRFLWFTTFPFVVFALAIIRPMIELFFGKSYEMFWLSGAIFLIWTILLPINEVNDRAMVAMGKMWLSLSFRIIYLVLLIIGLLTLIPKYHLEGYVIGWGISYFIYVSIQTFWLKQVTQEKLSSMLIPSTFSIFFLAVAFSIASFATVSKSILYASILFFVVLVIEWLWLLTVEEKKLLFTQYEKILNNLKISISKE